eukprot:992027-Prymnesium_polylepis.2
MRTFALHGDLAATSPKTRQRCTTLDSALSSLDSAHCSAALPKRPPHRPSATASSHIRSAPRSSPELAFAASPKNPLSIRAHQRNSPRAASCAPRRIRACHMLTYDTRKRHVNARTIRMPKTIRRPAAAACRESC